MFTNEIVVTKYNNKTMFFALVNNKPEYLEVLEENSLIGRIYVGRVENIVSNINSAFVRLSDKQNAYLAVKDVCPECVLNRDYKLSPKLRCGDLVLVQVTTDALKTKLPKLSCKISLSGKYSALTIGEKGVGCSRKLSDDKRHELTEAVKKAIFESKITYNGETGSATFNYGIIIRTDAAADGVTINDVLDDIQNVESTISDIFKKAVFLSGCQELRDNSDDSKLLETAKRFFHVVEGFNDGDILLVTDIETIYKKLLELKKEFPQNTELKYSDSEAEGSRKLSVIYGLQKKIDECLGKKVWLKSGGYLVIEQTEALNVIDVNTGKSIAGKKNIIEKLNIEAMEESMRQIRLRNLSGMILIDFINMKDKSDNEHLINSIKSMARLDPVMVNFVDITGLGIIELTRKKTGKSLAENIYSKS
ncbi:MAG: ribonuclease E/G [Butyrivibrio sp.]|nr:ribonuclease E/G [Butyrivibrio sp.]